MHSPFYDNIFSLTNWLAKKSRCSKRQVAAAYFIGTKLIDYGINHGFHEKCNCKAGVQDPECTHAEVMLIRQLPSDIPRDGLLLITYQPCLSCAPHLMAAGFKNILYRDAKPADIRGVQLLREYGININHGWNYLYEY